MDTKPLQSEIQLVILGIRKTYFLTQKYVSKYTVEQAKAYCQFSEENVLLYMRTKFYIYL